MRRTESPAPIGLTYPDADRIISDHARRTGSLYFSDSSNRAFGSAHRECAVRGPGGTFIATRDRSLSGVVYRVVRFGVDGCAPVTTAEARATPAVRRYADHYGDARFTTFAAADTAARRLAADPKQWTRRLRMNAPGLYLCPSSRIDFLHVNPETGEPVNMGTDEGGIELTFPPTFTPAMRNRVAALVRDALIGAELNDDRDTGA